MSKLVPHVVFRLGKQAFALALPDVKEVQRAGPLQPVPHAPASLAGLMGSAGQVSYVIDLRARFGLSPTPQPERAPVLQVEHDGQRYGLLVERIEEVMGIGSTQPLTGMENDPLWQGVVTGTVTHGDERVVVLDIDALIKNAA